MTEDLQQLLDCIRTEGVEKAQSEAKSLLDAAKSEASSIVSKANAEAEALRAEAQRAALAFERRSEQAIGQALRDVRLELAEDLRKLVEKLLRVEVADAFKDPDSVSAWITKAISAYLEGGEKQIEVELGGSLAAEASRLRAEIARLAAGEGVKVVDSKAFPAGFTIRLSEGRVEQPFTVESVTDALSRLLRPRIMALLDEVKA